jgi:hypothetical protein
MINYDIIAKSILENVNTASADTVHLNDGTEVVVADNAELNNAFKAEEARENRAAEYPPVEEYLDAVVKGDEAQKQAYIDACLAVKAKYPKPE